MQKMSSFSWTVDPRILSLESVDYFGTSEYFRGRAKNNNLYEQTSMVMNWSGVLSPVHQMSIDSVHRGDCAQIGGPALESTVINGRNNLPHPPTSNKPIIHWGHEGCLLKAGLANQQYSKKHEMKLIFKYGAVNPSVKTLLSSELLTFCILPRRRTLSHVARASMPGSWAHGTDIFNGI